MLLLDRLTISVEMFLIQIIGGFRGMSRFSCSWLFIWYAWPVMALLLLLCHGKWQVGKCGVLLLLLDVSRGIIGFWDNQ